MLANPYTPFKFTIFLQGSKLNMGVKCESLCCQIQSNFDEVWQIWISKFNLSKVGKIWPTVCQENHYIYILFAAQTMSSPSGSFRRPWGPRLPYRASNARTRSSYRTSGPSKHMPRRVLEMDWYRHDRATNHQDELVESTMLNSFLLALQKRNATMWKLTLQILRRRQSSLTSIWKLRA